MPDSPTLPAFDIPFDPVPVAKRHGGWTPEKQRGFIDALGVCGCVTAAAGHVGMTAKSAYRLRNRADAASFAAVWDLAAREGFARTRDDAVERAIHGEEVPVYRRGKQIGTRIRHDNQLMMTVIRHRTAQLYALASSIARQGSSDESADVS